MLNKTGEQKRMLTVFLFIKGGRSNLTVKKYKKHHTSAKWPRSTATMISHVNTQPLIWSHEMWQMALYLCGLPLKTYKPSNMWKICAKIKSKRQPIKYLISIPQNCQGHEKRGMFAKLPQSRGIKGIWKLNVM